jgi:hypothetical protein
VTPATRKLQPRPTSREDALAALRRASTYAFPLTISEYRHLVEVGEVDGPSVPWIMQLLGGWKQACDAAGVECGQPRRRGYESAWSDDDILWYVAEYVTTPGSRATFAGYDEWRNDARPEAPSGALIRQRLGGWRTVKRLAFEQIEAAQ